MVTINMSTEPISRGWERLSSNESLNQSGSNKQSSPTTYRYAAPNYFATSNYDAETSPVAASAGSRRSRISSYALPSSLPSSIEMQDVDISSTNPQGPPAPGTLPTPATQPNTSAKPYYQRYWFALLLTTIFFLISIGLNPHFFNEPWRRTSWSREGINEHLNVKQVIFATVPAKAIWSMFLATLALDVLILQMMYGYATVAATTTHRWSGMCRSLEHLFFFVIMVVQAVFMWGWLLWSI